MIELDNLHFATELQFIMRTISGKQQPSVEQFSIQLKVLLFWHAFYPQLLFA